MKTTFAYSAANQYNAQVANDLVRQLKAMAAPARPFRAAAEAKAAQEAPKGPKAPDRDGLLGGLLFDCLLGMPLSDMFADAVDLPMDADPALTCGTAVDMYDEFVRDRAKNNRTNGLEKGVSGAFNGMFGRVGEPAPRRLNLEDHYAVIARMKRPPGLYMAA